MSNFRFWVPIEDITKATDEKTGKTVMRLGGLASTKRKDTDGEDLDPEGFDISYLQERGIVNWNHNKSPEAIIGEPTKAELTKKGLHIECELYPDSELANKVYELATTLKKNSTKRRLGYSIEGKATLRDPLNPQSVKKAMITNVALTISPKNADSIVDIIKGEFHELSDSDIAKSNSNPLADFDMNANGGTTKYLVDITREDGTRILVDEEYRIKIDKALSAESSSGQAITRESVDGVSKIVAGPKDNLDKGEECLTKSEVIEIILENNSVISLEKATEIYQTLNNLAMSKTAITSELLNKALTQIGFNKSNDEKVSKDMEGNDIEESEEETEEEEENKSKKKADKLKKGEAGKKKDEDEEEEEELDEDREDDLNKYGHHKAMMAHHEYEGDEEDISDEKESHHNKMAKKHRGEVKKMKSKLGEMSDEDKDHLEKHHKKAGLDEDGEEVKDEKKLKRYADKNGEDEDGFEEHQGETEEEAEDDGIEKSLNSEAFVPTPEFFKSLGVALKATYDAVEKLSTKVDNQNKLIKAQADQLSTQSETIEELQEAIEKSNDTLEDISKAGGKPKSTMTATKQKSVEREFNKGNLDELNKGNEEENDGKTLSITQNKPQVMQLLDDLTFEKGMDDEFAKALTLFEASGSINQKVAARIKTEKGIVLVN